MPGRSCLLQGVLEVRWPEAAAHPLPPEATSGNQKIPIFPSKSIIMPANQTQRTAYWRENLRYLIILLIIWFIVSFGCGILFADQLNEYRVGGAKMGFWFAQQGAIYVFVVLIFVYVWLMNRLDKKYGFEE